MSSTAEGKSTTRRYNSAGRQRDAAVRQARVLEAARALFLEQGYGATSIDQIADAAGTSPQTVYATFGSKSGILRRVMDVAVGGDHEDIRLIERPEYGDAFAIADVRERIDRLSQLTAMVHRRSGELVALVERVAGSDPAVEELAAEIRGHQRSDGALMMETIPRDMFRRDLSPDQIIDITALLGGSMGWYDLVIRRGWTDEQYATWLSDALWRTLMEEQ